MGDEARGAGDDGVVGGGPGVLDRDFIGVLAGLVLATPRLVWLRRCNSLPTELLSAELLPPVVGVLACGLVCIRP